MIIHIFWMGLYEESAGSSHVCIGHVHLTQLRCAVVSELPLSIHYARGSASTSWEILCQCLQTRDESMKHQYPSSHEKRKNKQHESELQEK